MPLFGSNFAQGLATGFAESASKSIDNAMAQRNADVSAAKKFAMTRAAQLEEQATAKDKRTQNAIDKMASKFTENGETDWNRVYGAIMATDGGDLDSLDALFANMQKSSANGIEFDINDVFKFAEGDETLSQLSRDDIFQALRAEYEAPTVRTTDTTFLSKIGLGAGETGGEAATEQMRGLFPGATRTAIQGDYGTATLQQDKLASAIEYGMKVDEFNKNMIPSLAEEYVNILFKIADLDENATPEERKALQDRFDKISEAQANWTKLTTAETTTPGAMTATAYSKVIQNGRQSALELAGLSDKATFVTVDGETVPAADPNFAAAIKTARQKVIDDYNERQVRSQMNPDGTLSFLGAQIIGTDVAMGDIFRRISTSGEGSTDTAITGTGADSTESLEEQIANIVKKGPDIFGSEWVKANPTKSKEQLYDKLLATYPRESQLISRDEHRQQIADITQKIFNRSEQEASMPPEVDQIRASLSASGGNDSGAAITGTGTEVLSISPDIQKTIAALNTVSGAPTTPVSVTAVMKATGQDEAGAKILIASALKAKEQIEADRLAAIPVGNLTVREAKNIVLDSRTGTKEEYNKAIDKYVAVTEVSRERAEKSFPYIGTTSKE